MRLFLSPVCCCCSVLLLCTVALYCCYDGNGMAQRKDWERGHMEMLGPKQSIVRRPMGPLGYALLRSASPVSIAKAMSPFSSTGLCYCVWGWDNVHPIQCHPHFQKWESALGPPLGPPCLCFAVGLFFASLGLGDCTSCTLLCKVPEVPAYLPRAAAQGSFAPSSLFSRSLGYSYRCTYIVHQFRRGFPLVRSFTLPRHTYIHTYTRFFFVSPIQTLLSLSLLFPSLPFTSSFVPPFPTPPPSFVPRVPFGELLTFFSEHSVRPCARFCSLLWTPCATVWPRATSGSL